MEPSTRFMVDECLSAELVRILRDEYVFCLASHVTWIGKPPPGQKAWKDHSLVDRTAAEDCVFVTNNRRDFVARYYPPRLGIHAGLIIILEVDNLDHEIDLFRLAMQRILMLEDTVNKLIEVRRDGDVTVTDWPDHAATDPCADPATKGLRVEQSRSAPFTSPGRP
jgi:hypothetical protein